MTIDVVRDMSRLQAIGNFMSFRLFPCHRHCRGLGGRICRSATRGYASKLPSSNNNSNVSGNKIRWYGLGVVTSCSLGFLLWNASNSRRTALRPLSPDYFTTADLTLSEKTNESAKLLHLTLPPEVIKNAPKTNFQPIWSVYVKDSDIQVERPYTPLEGLSPSGEMCFWIKKYEHGEVGRWLHKKVPGEKIEIRGPEPTWTWNDDAWDNVIMVAGGTGIAPFFQLLHTLFSDPSRNTKTKFTLLQSYCSPKELPPPRILENLSVWERSNPDKLKIRTFVDNLDGGCSGCNLAVGRICKNDLKSALKTADDGGRTIVLVCGPDPMINALAGPKGRDQSQGPVGGVLGSLNDGTFKVWKL